jgi:hypothetical protein
VNGIDSTHWKYECAAGRHADTSTLALAHELGTQYTGSTIGGAAQCNKLVEVQYLYAQGCPWPNWLLETAARNGYFEVVRFCHEHDSPWDGDGDHAPRCAAESGNIELIDWLLQQPGMELSEEVVSAAAEEGHIAVCQYLHAQQCAWDETSTSNAAASGNLGLLRWLMDNGCPWYAGFLCMSAAQGDGIEVLLYLQQEGLLTSATLTDALRAAGSFDKFATAKWLREQGAEWPTVIKSGPWRGELLAWAISEGFAPPATYSASF